MKGFFSSRESERTRNSRKKYKGQNNMRKMRDIPGVRRLGVLSRPQCYKEKMLTCDSLIWLFLFGYKTINVTCPQNIISMHEESPIVSNQLILN